MTTAEIYQKFHVPKHVQLHMLKVKEVCKIIADAFIKRGYKINKPILLQAAEIHDALRVADFKTFAPETFPHPFTTQDMGVWQELREKYGKIGHAKALSNILKEMGESALANLVAKHDFLEIDDLETWEEKILYYSDKRVEGDKITALKDRLQKGKQRNSHTPKERQIHDQVSEKIFALEDELKAALGGQLPL